MRTFKVSFDYDNPYDTLHALVVLAKDLEDAKSQVKERAASCHYDNKDTLVSSAKYEECTSRSIILEDTA